MKCVLEFDNQSATEVWSGELRQLADGRHGLMTGDRGA